MRIGIIGLGSIGRRHANALLSLGVDEIIAYRTKKGALKETTDNLNQIKEVYDWQEFVSSSFDGIIIANPTALHAPTLEKLVALDIPIFVEKPIFSDLSQIGQLADYSKNIIVGYCLRFSESLQKVKSLLAELGDIRVASFYRSYYLPYWHPYADYSKEYTARKDLGGGVIRTLSHEIDLMLFFFGQDIQTVSGYVDKVSNLKIDTDDIAFFHCKYKNGLRVNFELDFLGPKYVNNARFIGDKGALYYDFSTKEVTKYLYSKETESYPINDEDLDKMYINQMRDFLNFLKNRVTKNSSFDDALTVLKLISRVENVK
jgi:predicted dehydrogenase